MSEHEPHDELFSRLQLFFALTTEKLAGAEFAILVRLTLGQSVSARELNMTRQGYKRALEALEARLFICRDGEEPQLHPEICAKYGMTTIETDAKGVDLLRKLANGSLENKLASKNLYRCNADGVPASEEEMKLLFEKLENAALRVAAWLRKPSQSGEIKKYCAPYGVSREMHMRGLASVVESFLDGRLAKAWPGSLDSAVHFALRTAHSEYTRVRDPHQMLERFCKYQRKVAKEKAASLALANKPAAMPDKQGGTESQADGGAGIDRPPAA